jgi:hypothetical protein
MASGTEFMTIQEFATSYQLKLRQDSCGDPIIPGKPRKAFRQEDKHHIYADGDRLGLCLMHKSVKAFHNAQKRLVEAGFVPNQLADSEGTFLFDSNDSNQARVAIREAGCKEKRKMSPRQIEVLNRMRQTPPPRRVLGL